MPKNTRATILKNKVICICPEMESDLAGILFDQLVLSPLDTYRYQKNCCNCISLRVASAVVCFMSVFWGSAEIMNADKFMARIFPDRGDEHAYCKYAYWGITGGFLLASVVLAVGLIIKKYIPVTIYVWYAFIFMCLYLVVYAISIGFLIGKNRLTKRQLLRAVAAVFWNCLFFYLLNVVNSYRINLWIYSELDK